VGNTVSHHPNDKREAIPTVEAIPAEMGKPEAAALDNGYFSLTNIEELEARGIEPYIATGGDRHHQSKSGLPQSRRPLLRMPAPSSRWPTNSRPRWAS